MERQSSSSLTRALADREVVRQLLAGSPSCCDRWREAGWGEKRVDRLFRLSAEDIRRAEDAEPPFAVYDYDQAFAGAEQSLVAMFDRELPPEEEPETLLAELLALPGKEQSRRAADEPRFAHPGVARALIDRSHQARFADPQSMAHLANLARLVSEACSADAAGNERRLADLRARSWAQHGNALRACGRLREAGEALATAQRFCDAGTRDPLVRAGLLEKLAALSTSQARFNEALELATGAEAVYRDLDEHHCLAGIMIQKAIAWLQTGQPEEAVRTLNRAIPLIDGEGDPHLLLAATHNLIRCYIDLDQPEQAFTVYTEARDLYKGFSDPVVRLRAGWQEGQLLRDLGHLEAGETALLEARQGFLDRGLPIEFMSASRDLVTLYSRAGNARALKSFVEDTVSILRDLRVQREAIAAFLQFVRS